MNRYKIIAIDLDGTLLNDNKNIFPRTITLLNKSSEDK